jgi:hypothetical protein
MLALVTLATEAAGHETSKAGFYIAGLVLAGFAVLVGLLGIMRPSSFAMNAAGRSLVVAIAAVLVVGACASAVLTA